MVSGLVRISPLDRVDYRELISTVSELVWPEFMFHDPVAADHWNGLFEDFPDYQFAFLGRGGAEVVGIANSVPLAWDGPVEALPDEGWDWALRQSAWDRGEELEPHTLCAIQISVHPDHQRQGLSTILLEEMLRLAKQKGVTRLVAPVRPSLKHRYPLTPIERYVEWRNEDGSPFDPWLRVHVRCGGRIIRVCHQAMRIAGSIGEWESWTGMRFPEGGKHIVPGALTPVEMDQKNDLGVYIEPNVWMLHEVRA
jgi:GNAT superfamily N-acetyltransferase